MKLAAELCSQLHKRGTALRIGCVGSWEGADGRTSPASSLFIMDERRQLPACSSYAAASRTP